MKSRAPVFIAFLLTLVAVPAFAAGPYVGGNAGAVFLSDSTVSLAGLDFADTKFKTGFGVGLLGGFDFGTWRLEGEFAYRKNDNKDITSEGSTAPIGGDVSSMALMGNAYYDFRMFSPTFVPYIGGGLGFVQVKAKVTDPPDIVIDGSDMVMAYQFATGVGFAVSPKLTLDLGYKYFAATDSQFEISDGGGFKLGMEYKSHNIFLGARYSF